MQQFIADLNRLYCLKSHLTERIVDLEGHLSFSRMSYAIKELIKQTDAELENLDAVFLLLGEENSFEACSELINYLEGIYTDLTDAIETPALAHVLFYEYLSQVKAIEKTCMASMCRISMTIDNPELKSVLRKELDRPECQLLKTFKTFYPASFGYNVEKKNIN
jgi:ferritin-like metal-binding protein YciE